MIDVAGVETYRSSSKPFDTTLRWFNICVISAPDQSGAGNRDTQTLLASNQSTERVALPTYLLRNAIISSRLRHTQ